MFNSDSRMVIFLRLGRTLYLLLILKQNKIEKKTENLL